MQENNISVNQFRILVIFYTIGTTILIIPAGLAADAKQDAWIASVVGVGFGLLLVMLYNLVGKRFPEMNLIQFNEALFGRWIGKGVSLLVVFFSFIGSATLLFYVGNFITTQVMPDTPIQFINMLFLSIVIMGFRLGIETIARAAEILFPWFLMLFIVLCVFISPEIKMENLQPVFDTGIKPIMKAALSLAGTAYLTLIVFFMIFPLHVSDPLRARKVFPTSALVGGMFIILVTFLSIAVLGADTTSRNVYPSYALAKKVSVGNFVERIESIMAGMWFMSIFFKMTMYFYACTSGLAQILNLKDHRPVSLPLGMIVVVYSLVVYPNVAYMGEWDSTIFIPYVLSFGLVLPLIWLCAAAWKRKKKSK